MIVFQGIIRPQRQRRRGHEPPPMDPTLDIRSDPVEEVGRDLRRNAQMGVGGHAILRRNPYRGGA